MNSPTLKGHDVILRRIKKTDIEDRILCGRNDELTFMYGGEKKEEKPYTQADGEKWYAKQMARKPGWIIEHMGHCIGEVFLHQIDMNDKRARFAIGIFDSNLIGKGLGTEATKLVLDFAFNTLKLHRVDLRVLDYNKRAIRSYEKAGFKVEGIERESAFIRGKWHNDVMMSILEQEYTSTK